MSGARERRHRTTRDIIFDVLRGDILDTGHQVFSCHPELVRPKLQTKVAGIIVHRPRPNSRHVFTWKSRPQFLSETTAQDRSRKTC